MREFRFAYLLASLVFVAFVRPFLGDRILGLALVDILLFITLLAGAYAVIEQRATLYAVATLGLISAGAQITFGLSKSPAATGVFLTATLLFYSSVTWASLRTLFRHHARVTRDTLCQAMSVYLLIGMIGAMSYALLELASPNSFRFAQDLVGTDARFDRFLGFSFTTLTTLGYGNIAPASPRADAIATLQAVFGQIYLAIVIARLVSIQVGQHASAGATGGDAPNDSV